MGIKILDLYIKYNKLKWYYKMMILFVLTLLLSVLGHSFYIYRYMTEGTVMTGPNDGMEQMLPFQMYIYNKFTRLKFFYDMDFGLGGDYYSDLSYYYSTSVVFLINMIVVKLLDVISLGALNTDDVSFWAKNAFYISIFKSALGMLIMYYYLQMVNVKKHLSLVGGFLFFTSAIYFRFTLYWSFFSDVFIFLPLLLLGIELYIQKGKRLLFIISVALILINNFYFAYQLVIVGVVYFLFRNIFRKDDDIISRKEQWVNFVIMSVLGLLISLYSFYYGVTSFLGNDRESYKEKLTIFNEMDELGNIFYDNYLLIVIFLTIPALLSFRLYKDYWYKFFAVGTTLLLILSLTPYMDSLFNGLSAPQKRWHYLITFFSSVIIVKYLSEFKKVSLENYIYSAIATALVLFASDFYIGEKRNVDITWINYAYIYLVVGLIYKILTNQYIRNKLTLETNHYNLLRRGLYIVLVLGLIVINLDTVRLHNLISNYNPGINDRANVNYMESDNYNSTTHKEIIKMLNKDLKDDERIDFRVKELNNAPLYLGYKGVSLYSSIFSGDLIDFYYRDLMINLKHESISRYSAFQSRSNIESLFNVKYAVREVGDTEIPNNFKLVKEYKGYNIYENTLKTNFIKITDKVFLESDLKTPIDREHAMLLGMVVSDSDKNKVNKKIKESQNVALESKVNLVNANYNGDTKELNVLGQQGGMEFTIPKKLLKGKKDVYINVEVKSISPKQNFYINVNGYNNERLFNGSKYQTQQDDLLYRVGVSNIKQNNNKIKLLLKGGVYKVVLKGIYLEDYKVLESVNKDVNNLKYKFKEDGRKMTIELNSQHKGGYLVAPIVYREGMTAYIDGKATDISQVNYIMSAVKVGKESKTIEIRYLPPHYKLMVSLSLLGLILSYLYLRYYNNTVNTKIKVSKLIKKRGKDDVK